MTVHQSFNIECHMTNGLESLNSIKTLPVADLTPTSFADMQHPPEYYADVAAVCKSVSPAGILTLHPSMDVHYQHSSLT